VVIPSLFNCNLEEFRDSSPKLFEIPFNSRNKWQLSVHKVHWDVEHHIVLLKGAPDVILDKCSHYIGVGGEKRLIDAEFMNHYRTQYEEFGGNVNSNFEMGMTSR
jgi:sodium/potassium-transporting ATPase subunit alpha